jgi:hypothetical protein
LVQELLVLTVEIAGSELLKHMCAAYFGVGGMVGVLCLTGRLGLFSGLEMRMESMVLTQLSDD